MPNSDVPWRLLRAGAKATIRKNVDLTVVGAEHLPASGPTMIAARHFHHLYDGCAVLATVARPLHIVVALDWVSNRAGRAAMERACAAAGWPVVLRPGGPTAVDQRQAALAFREATEDALHLLGAGRVLLVFPEGYPNVDPGYTPKQGDDAWLPFQSGFVRLATLAALNGLEVPIVPAGLHYQRGTRWRVLLRFGEPICAGQRADEAAIRAEIEARVRFLSGP